MSDRLEELQKKLNFMKHQGLLRGQHIFQGGQDPKTLIDQEEYVLFSSSNYLSMGSRKDLFQKAAKEAEAFGLGSGGSRLTTGNSTLHLLCEEKLAKFVKREAAILFSSGYMANVGVISSICDKSWEIYSDEKNHASIIDGCCLSRAKIFVYGHLDYKELEKQLAASSCKKKLIVSDGVFSMDGDVAEVETLVSLANKYHALSMIDDAHGFGVLGDGHGICFNMEKKPDIYMGTLSKAICCEGAFVAGSLLLKNYLLNCARSYVFSTSLSPFVLCAVKNVLEELEKNKEPLHQLEENVKYFHEQLRKFHIPTKGQTHIVPIKIGSENRAMEIAEELKQKKYYVSGIRYPSVPKAEAILRITLMSNHTREQMWGLIQEIQKFFK